MCGIAGVYGWVDNSQLDAMLGCISHRGPDDQGEFFDHHAELMMGARRLAIVDLAGGDQPISNEDGDVTVVFNGEIYNYPDLREQLESEGHNFSSSCDTEVLVHLWEEYGEKMPEHLNGMFAFSIWDASRECLFVARDRLGIKPLYFSHSAEGFVWGSEIQAILAAGVSRDLNEQAVYNYFSLRYSPWPQTLFANIQKLRPGSSILVTEEDISRRDYWELQRREISGSASSIATEVRNLLETSIERRQMADVPIGAFLSGGIDSSAVVGLMSELLDDPIRTFSVGFEDQSIDESSEAEFVADHFGTNHHELQVDLSSMDIFGDLVTHYGEPLSDPAALPTMLLSRYAADRLKVVLTGEGADELFGGYWYDRRIPAHRSWSEFLPNPTFDVADVLNESISVGSKYTDYLASLRNDEEVLLYLAQRFGGPPEQYLASDLTPETSGLRDLIRKATAQGGEDTLSRITAFDIRHWLPDDLLYKVDHASMSASLEVRVPFLDHELVEYAFNIPSEYKTNNQTKKSILRRAVKDILPERTLQRSKHGFVVPVDDWFANESEAIARWLTEDNVAQAPYLNQQQVFDIWSNHKSGNVDHSGSLWKILNYVAWYQEVVDGDFR